MLSGELRQAWKTSSRGAPPQGTDAPRRPPVRDHPAAPPAEAGARPRSGREARGLGADHLPGRARSDGEPGPDRGRGGRRLCVAPGVRPAAFDVRRGRDRGAGAGRQDHRVLDRCQARRRRRQRDRQGRGGDPGAPAPAHGETALLAPARHFAHPISVDPSALRLALRRRLKVHFCYRDGEERASARTVRPLALSFYGPAGCWSPGASCARISARSGSTGWRSSTCSTSASAPSPARPSRTF